MVQAMDNIETHTIPFVPVGLVRLWLCVADFWAALGTPEMVIALLCCSLCVHLGESDHQAPAEVVPPVRYAAEPSPAYVINASISSVKTAIQQVRDLRGKIEENKGG